MTRGTADPWHHLDTRVRRRARSESEARPDAVGVVSGFRQAEIHATALIPVPSQKPYPAFVRCRDAIGRHLSGVGRRDRPDPRRVPSRLRAKLAHLYGTMRDDRSADVTQCSAA
jgi:hypothetical protein